MTTDAERRAKHAAYMREWLKNPENKRKQAESRKRWLKKNPYYYALYEQGYREKRRAIQRKVYARHPTRGSRTPQMKKAHDYVERHPELKASACELCPPHDVITEGLHAHHPDYSYPNIVVTCCPSCHKFATSTLTTPNPQEVTQR